MTIFHFYFFFLPFSTLSIGHVYKNKTIPSLISFDHFGLNEEHMLIYQLPAAISVDRVYVIIIFCICWLFTLKSTWKVRRDCPSKYYKCWTQSLNIILGDVWLLFFYLPTRLSMYIIWLFMISSGSMNTTNIIKTLYFNDINW